MCRAHPSGGSSTSPRASSAALAAADAWTSPAPRVGQKLGASTGGMGGAPRGLFLTCLGESATAVRRGSRCDLRRSKSDRSEGLQWMASKKFASLGGQFEGPTPATTKAFSGWQVNHPYCCKLRCIPTLLHRTPPVRSDPSAAVRGAWMAMSDSSQSTMSVAPILVELGARRVATPLPHGPLEERPRLSSRPA